MLTKEKEEIAQMEESLKDIRLLLKQTATSIRLLEGKLRRVNTALERKEAHADTSVKRQRKGSLNPLQAELNSLPLEERQKFLAQHTA